MGNSVILIKYYRHNAGDWHAAMSSAGRSINTGGVPNGIYGTTSSAFQPMMSSVNLNTKAPMSMTDEEFRAQFIPNAPPAEPTMIPMQVLSIHSTKQLNEIIEIN